MKKIIISSVICFLAFLISGDALAQSLISEMGVYDKNTNIFFFIGERYNFLVSARGKEGEWGMRESKVLYKYDFKTEKIESFYSADNEMSDIQIASDSSAVAMIENGKIVVLSLNSNKILKFGKNIHQFVWGQNSREIIYVTGIQVGRDEASEFKGNGLWVIDLENEKTTKISESGGLLRTVLSDKHIYLYSDGKPYMCNLKEKKIERVDYELYPYSYDKKYYYQYYDPEVYPFRNDDPYGSNFRIFETETNSELSPRKISFISERRPEDVFWVNESHIIVFRGLVKRGIYNEQRIFIYDLDDDLLMKEIKGEVVGTSVDKDVLVVFHEGKFYKQTIALTKKK